MAIVSGELYRSFIYRGTYWHANFDMAGINTVGLTGTVMLHRLESREPSNILQQGDEDLTPSGLLLENISSRRRRSICEPDQTTAGGRMKMLASTSCSIPVNTFRSTVELRAGL